MGILYCVCIPLYLIIHLPMYFGSDSQTRSALICGVPSTNDNTLQHTKTERKANTIKTGFHYECSIRITETFTCLLRGKNGPSISQISVSNVNCHVPRYLLALTLLSNKTNQTDTSFSITL